MRKERVLAYVVERCREQQPVEGVTAREVAEALGIWRNDVTVELNRLVAEGKLCREGKKNIRFFPPQAAGASGEDPGEQGGEEELPSAAFSRLVGAGGSLKHQISVAKAAAAYPSHGLNMLILGPTGSGKSAFAHAVWEYAREIGAFGARNGEIPYVVFNCAEYADNPQLLLSQLFGYRKGAFTGATEDKVGLVEEANGGILLLDEIHHLSAAGQELFFTLLDTGLYHRLGDNTTREARFMLIGATTKPVTDLLDTFLRRMPVLIQMPALSERPMNERLEFIEYFYAEEGARVGRELRIKREVLNALMDYTLHVNLGTLKNTIQISCAKGYLRQFSREGGGEITVTFSDLSLQSYGGEERAGGAEAVHVFQRDLLIAHGRPRSAGSDVPAFADIYDFVDRHLEQGLQRGLSSEDLQQMVVSEVDNYYVTLDRVLQEPGTDMNLLNSVLFPGCVGISAEFLGMASRELNRSYPPTAPVLLAMHISQYVDRMRSEQPAFPPDFRDVMKGYVRETEFLRRSREWLSGALKVKITDDEMNVLAILLRRVADQREAPAIWITAVSGGEQTASSMSKYINSVCNTSHLHWVNSRSDGAVESMFRRVCENIRTFHGSGGNLIFTDMKVLSGLEVQLSRSTGVPCKVVPILEQHLLMEACQVTMALEADLESTARQILSNYSLFLRGFFQGAGIPWTPIPQEGEQERSKIVLSVCVTGIGSARSVKDVLEKRLSYIPGLRVVALSTLEDFQTIRSHYGGALRLVVGTVDPGLPGVPFLSAERVFTASGMQYLSTVLDDWESGGCVADAEGEEAGGEALGLLRENFQFIAPNVDRDRAVLCIGRMMDALERRHYHRPLPQDVRVRLFMHAASMLERVMAGEPLEEDPRHEEQISAREAWFQFLEETVREAFRPFGREIPRSEIYYFMLSLPEDL